MSRGSWVLLSLLVCLLEREGRGKREGYCATPCRNTWDDEHPHTMCKYESSEPSAFCGEYRNYGRLNRTAKKLIVDVHNRLRDRVALGQQMDERGELMPTAANMMELKWDEELAEIAQRWVDQCILGQDLCRDVKRFKVGQNAAVTTHDLNSAEELKTYTPTEIAFWFNKVQEFSFAEHKKIDSLQTFGQWPPTNTQFTQLIWANTSALGCGRAVFEREAKLHELVACNYGPAGNVYGQVVYVVGPPCSFCPGKTSCSKRYDALCSVDGRGRNVTVRVVQEETAELKRYGKKSRGSSFYHPVIVLCACVLRSLAIL